MPWEEKAAGSQGEAGQWPSRRIFPCIVKCQQGLEAAGTVRSNWGPTKAGIPLEVPVRDADGLARVALGHRNQRNVKLENPSEHYF